MVLKQNKILRVLQSLNKDLKEKTFNLVTLNNFLLLIVFIIFSVKAFISLDPDFGYRLRTGQIIIEQGVPKKDLFTYTMPSFPWVDHAWLTDTVIYLVYSNSGKIGLSILFSFLAVCSLVISRKIFALKDKFLEYPVFITAASVMLPFFAVRVQVVTWFLSSVLFLVILNESFWKRYKYLIPIFFTVWANFHGGFFAGLTILYICLGARFFEKKKLTFSDLIIVILSTIATFINPYRLELYREVWSSVSDSRLKFEIVEWMPAIISFDLPRIFLVVLSVVFVSMYKMKITLKEKVSYLFLLLQGVLSVRNIPIWVLISLPLTIKSVGYFYEDMKVNKVTSERFQKVFTVFVVFTIAIILLQLLLSYKGGEFISEDKFYPEKAVSYIKNNLPVGEVFSDYAWGGYLIWKLPEKKVFIDGRMPSWEWEANIESETNDAFEEYLNIRRGRKDYKEYFDKYSISLVLLPKKEGKTFIELLEEKYADKFEALYRLLGYEGISYKFNEKLEKDGWRKTYEDDNSVIYQRG